MRANEFEAFIKTITGGWEQCNQEVLPHKPQNSHQKRFLPQHVHQDGDFFPRGKMQIFPEDKMRGNLAMHVLLLFSYFQNSSGRGKNKTKKEQMAFPESQAVSDRCALVKFRLPVNWERVASAFHSSRQWRMKITNNLTTKFNFVMWMTTPNARSLLVLRT